jgi:hypothetical protein
MDQFARPNTPADVASATLTEVADAARNQYDSVLVAMRRNPFTSVAIAAGVVSHWQYVTTREDGGSATRTADAARPGLRRLFDVA